ncbi:FtsX-like permease family protein [Roseivirga sp.]|uniref:FtsX-like permease family protein n=1 Tax=Roseivirga sp. TaxID=1964215 RepID=UPI002B266696|nr:FtsX-like permease family protein [Roseivirga sp.]
MRITPPKLYTRLFKAFCKPTLYQELQGDLEEEFNFNLKTLGEKKAKAIYRNEVLKMIRPSVIRKPKIMVNMFRTSLFQIHLKLAFRNLWRNKVFSAINIFGLAAAITVSMFALNIIYTGLSVDKQHPHTERLYRVISKIDRTNGVKYLKASASPLLGDKLREDLPEIEVLTQIRPYYSFNEVINGNSVSLNQLSVDENFFEVFQFKTIAGDPKAALKDRSGYIITDELAKRYFPNENPMGKSFGSGAVISAVIESPKGISHLDFDIIKLRIQKPIYANPKDYDQFESWDFSSQDYVYLRTFATVSQEQLDAKLGVVAKDVNLLMKEKEYTLNYQSQQINEIMFTDEIYNPIGFNAPKEFLYILISLITILLLLASFNYTNLSIARAIQRTKEIGIRKVAGSTKSQIIGQILVETIVFSIAATLVGYLLYQFFVPEFVALMDTGDALFNPNTTTPLLLVFLGFSVIVGLIAGLFPALYFSRISPLSAFRSNIKSKVMSLMNIRKGLVVIQLTISMFCIMVVTAGSDLYSSILNNNWNFEQDGVVNLEVAFKNRQLLKTRFEQVPGVVGVSAVSSLPGVRTMGMTTIKRPNSADSVFINFSIVDSDFNKVFKPKLFAGNNFERLSSDSTLTEVWVNRKLLSDLRIPLDSALGYTLSIQNNIARYQIIGIMEDYLFDRLDAPEVKPIIVAHEKIDLYRRSLAIKIESQNMAVTLNQLEKATKEVDRNQAFTPIFLNDSIEESYNGISQIVKGFKFLSVIIIAISLLGQLGIALYNAETRTKEIGIRKVLGARVKNIILMLLKGTLITLTISAFIGAPLAYLFLNESFWSMTVVETSFHGLVLAQGILLLGSLVVFVVIAQTWRVAQANPTESLRSE